jgi:hypothetical protein
MNEHMRSYDVEDSDDDHDDSPEVQAAMAVLVVVPLMISRIKKALLTVNNSS